MVLRFVFAKAERRTRRRCGIFRDVGIVCRESSEAEEILGWLNRRLPVPPETAFSAGRALSWFKLDARRCIQKMRDLAFLLERRGERVWQIYSRNPGLITYEDEFQVVAVPESVRLRNEA